MQDTLKTVIFVTGIWAPLQKYFANLDGVAWPNYFDKCFFFHHQIFPSIPPEWKTTNIFILWSTRKKSAKDSRLHPGNFCDILKLNWGYSPIRMTFYSTKFSNWDRIKHSNIFARSNARNFVISSSSYQCLFFPHQIFLSIPPKCKTTNIFILWSTRKKSAKDSRLHPDKNCDILKLKWSYSPICMTFYSTKFSNWDRIKYSGIFPRSNARNFVILWNFL